MLTRDEILNADDLKRVLVNVPEWGGDIYVRMLTGTERDSFEQAIVETKGKGVQMNLQNVRARLCALTMVDEEGKRLFQESDINTLGKKSSAALDHVFTAAQKLNHLTSEDVEELVKN